MPEDRNRKSAEAFGSPAQAAGCFGSVVWLWPGHVGGMIFRSEVPQGFEYPKTVTGSPRKHAEAQRSRRAPLRSLEGTRNPPPVGCARAAPPPRPPTGGGEEGRKAKGGGEEGKTAPAAPRARTAGQPSERRKKNVKINIL